MSNDWITDGAARSTFRLLAIIIAIIIVVVSAIWLTIGYWICG